MPGRDFAHAWDESVHFAHAQRHIFAWRGPCVFSNAKTTVRGLDTLGGFPVI